MKIMLEVCLVTVAITCVAGAQSKPALQQGVHVDLPVAAHAIEMPAADKENATIATLTADGSLFVGTEPAEISALSSLSSGTLYVKADARVPYQTILNVLDALHGKSVVLLTAPSVAAKSAKIAQPYGVKVSLAGE
jgi:biopolymer transport protein ExbD